MNIRLSKLAIAMITLGLLTGMSSSYAATPAEEIQKLREDMNKMRDMYERRLSEIEKQNLTKHPVPHTSHGNTLNVTHSELNERTKEGVPEGLSHEMDDAEEIEELGAGELGVTAILSGTYGNTSRPQETPYALNGFLPFNKQRYQDLASVNRGFNLDDSDISFVGRIDDHFYGRVVVAQSPEGQANIEEAYILTRGLKFLDKKIAFKAGRFYSGVGLLNQQHAHDWDFIDISLPHKIFLGEQYNDDGVQAKWYLPIQNNMTLELGGEVSKGRAYPGSGKDKNGSGAGAVFAKFRGHFAKNHFVEVGLSQLRTNAHGREFSDFDANGLTTTNQFSGDTKINIAHFLWKWAPTGDPADKHLKVQGEYFQRKDNGTLGYDITGLNQTNQYAAKQSGYYLQATYQFMPKWRIGFRTEKLDYGTVSATNLGNFSSIAHAYSPTRNSAVLEFSPSEKGRLRLQVMQDKSQPGITDNQIMLQYQMSIGKFGIDRF